MEEAYRGNDPTLITAILAEGIYITVATIKASRLVSNWQDIKEPSLSDNCQICFDIKCENPRVSPDNFRHVSKTDWDYFRNDPHLSINACPSRARTIGDAELMADAANTAITKAYESNCPLTIKQGTKRIPWWNKYLVDIKVETMRLFNRVKKNGEWGLYRT